MSWAPSKCQTKSSVTIPILQMRKQIERGYGTGLINIWLQLLLHHTVSRAEAELTCLWVFPTALRRTLGSRLVTFPVRQMSTQSLLCWLSELSPQARLPYQASRRPLSQWYCLPPVRLSAPKNLLRPCETNVHGGRGACSHVPSNLLGLQQWVRQSFCPSKSS